MSTTRPEADRGFVTSQQHVLAELARLDVLLGAAVGRMRGHADASDAGLSAYVISEAEVDALLDPPVDITGPAAEADALREQIAGRVASGVRAGAQLRLVALAQLFGLSQFDVDVVVICLAPEIDRRYERLYGYLHDDLTRRAPSVGLVLDLLCLDMDARWRARTRLGAQAPLRRHELLLLDDPPEHPAPTLLGRTVRLDPRIAGFLLDDDAPDERLRLVSDVVEPESSLADLVVPAELGARLAALATDPAPDLLVHLRGTAGVGRRSAAAALCAAWGADLLVVRGARLAGETAEAFATTLRRLDREARLQGAVLYWDDVDGLLTDDREAQLELLLTTLAAYPGPACLSGWASWEPPAGIELVRLELSAPGDEDRRRLWSAAIDGAGIDAAASDVAELAARFRLTGGQIRGAVATARGLARARAPRVSEVSSRDLHEACRLRSNCALAGLAQRITPRRDWDELVLPADRTEQLREIVDQVRHRATVYERWGFEHTATGGRGLNVLFAGPSGTGKTMAADVLARTLGLDLYAVDLSSVVSKYIGETEKHLARIFDEAATSNAVLFFDEADALFGKRTQVRDAHDRYANLETSYLLQKLERHEGVVVLATNLRKNMDEAFVRRLHATVEFPVPDEADRLRIWTRIWPRAAPRDPDLDLAALARHVDLPGGNIRNIALAGAFLAAADGGVVTMEHLVRATGREFQKIGRVGSTGELDVLSGRTGHTAPR